MEYHPNATKDYAHTKMYVIRNHETGKQYVGHTTYLYLSQRLRGHRQKFTNWKLGKEPWQSSFDVLDEDTTKYSIELLEAYPCGNVEEARKREQWWIFILRNGCVNKEIPGRTKEEYQSKWRQENVITIQCPCGGAYQNIAGKKERHDETAKHKYYVEHGSVKPMTEKYLANREEILAKQKERDRIRRNVPIR